MAQLWSGTRRPSQRDERGFTLVELMVVVLIMAILLAIAVPTYLGARTNAENRATQASLTNALGTAQSYWNSHQSYSGLSNAGMAAREPNLNFASPSSGGNTIAFSVGSQGYSVSLAAMSSSGTCWYIADVEDTSSAWIGTAGIPHPRTYYGSTPSTSSCVALTNGQTPKSGWLSSFNGTTVPGTAPSYSAPNVTWTMPSGPVYQGGTYQVSWSFTPPTTGAYQGWNEGWDGSNGNSPTFQSSSGQASTSALSTGTHNVTLDFFFNGQPQQVSSPAINVVVQQTPVVTWTMPTGPIYQGATDQVAWHFTGYNGSNYAVNFQPNGSTPIMLPGGTSGAKSTSTLATGTYTTVLTFFYSNGSSQHVTSPSFTVSAAAFTGVVNVGSRPSGVAITPNGQFAYVANMYQNSVSVVNLGTGQVTATIPNVGTWPSQVLAYNGNIFVGSSVSNTISVISQATNAITNTISVAPYGLGQMAAANGYLFVADSYFLQVVSLRSYVVLTSFMVGAKTYGLTLTNKYIVAPVPGSWFVINTQNLQQYYFSAPGMIPNKASASGTTAYTTDATNCVLWSFNPTNIAQPSTAQSNINCNSVWSGVSPNGQTLYYTADHANAGLYYTPIQANGVPAPGGTPIALPLPGQDPLNAAITPGGHRIVVSMADKNVLEIVKVP